MQYNLGNNKEDILIVLGIFIGNLLLIRNYHFLQVIKTCESMKRCKRLIVKLCIDGDKDSGSGYLYAAS